eukprot:GHVQ01026091.1.p1 GENE.GHVQ01026091.1~~GHVQ01026091.1.p1  ORF type:complete len:729 (+),score=159.01 GHVQ01026091.1:724-2910(+)
MSIEQLMALVPIESAESVKEKGRRTRWDKIKSQGSSRFGVVDDKPYLPPAYIDLPPGLTPLQIDQFFREQRYDELTKKLAAGELEFGDPDIRPPSPPPTYDKLGSRTNTRDVRVRNSMMAEYHRLVEFLAKTVEGFDPPADFKPMKKIKRIEIPLEKYPEYNFMGLIIGPRGCNHKRLEAESGTQISVRGKGTQKEGKKTDHQTDEEASMPMHVHIAADTEDKLEKAVGLIEPLLDPFHPMHEDFKKRGLEQLALVNGLTMSKIDQRCAVCGGTGHFAYECPDAQQLQNFKKPQVRCAICGDMGHVTMDCKMRPEGGIPPPPPSGTPPPPPPRGMRPQTPQQQYYEKMKMDNEYRKMMTELSGGSSGLDDVDGPGKQSSPASNPPGVSPPGAMVAPSPPSHPYPTHPGYGAYPPRPPPPQFGGWPDPSQPWGGRNPYATVQPWQQQMPGMWPPPRPPPYGALPPGSMGSGGAMGYTGGAMVPGTANSGGIAAPWSEGGQQHAVGGMQQGVGVGGGYGSTMPGVPMGPDAWGPIPPPPGVAAQYHQQTQIAQPPQQQPQPSVSYPGQQQLCASYGNTVGYAVPGSSPHPVAPAEPPPYPPSDMPPLPPDALHSGEPSLPGTAPPSNSSGGTVDAMSQQLMNQWHQMVTQQQGRGGGGGVNPWDSMSGGGVGSSMQMTHQGMMTGQQVMMGQQGLYQAMQHQQPPLPPSPPPPPVPPYGGGVDDSMDTSS